MNNNVFIPSDSRIFNGEDSIFAKRLFELASFLRHSEDKSSEDIANDLEISRQTLWKYVMGKAIPNTKRLLSIARYFDVSTDYLLGISNVPDSYIGLSFEAVNILEEWSKDYQTAKLNSIFNTLLLPNEAFDLHNALEELLNNIDQFKEIRDIDNSDNKQLVFQEEKGILYYGVPRRERDMLYFEKLIEANKFAVIKEVTALIDKFVDIELGKEAIE